MFSDEIWSIKDIPNVNFELHHASQITDLFPPFLMAHTQSIIQWKKGRNIWWISNRGSISYYSIVVFLKNKLGISTSLKMFWSTLDFWKTPVMAKSIVTKQVFHTFVSHTPLSQLLLQLHKSLTEFTCLSSSLFTSFSSSASPLLLRFTLSFL